MARYSKHGVEIGGPECTPLSDTKLDESELNGIERHAEMGLCQPDDVRRLVAMARRASVLEKALRETYPGSSGEVIALYAAQLGKLTHAVDKFADCVNEFGEDAPRACGELFDLMCNALNEVPNG